MSETRVVVGPVAEMPGGVLYHVTLESGMVITNPSGFGDGDMPKTPACSPLIAENGDVLTPTGSS